MGKKKGQTAQQVQQSSGTMGKEDDFFSKIHIPARYATLILMVALTLSMINAFSLRLFSVLRYESVIHEFDPYFNFRSTKILVEQGFEGLWNWFDPISWYPLGRTVGGTVYPGIMWTAGLAHYVLHALHFTVDIRNVCVLTAPWFSANTVLVTYFLGVEASGRRGAGLVAAVLISTIPGYISRSVAGSFDNEGIAIFALLLVFFLWLRALNRGSMLWSALCAIAYFYMVSAWGGYVFIINLIPLHALTLILSGRLSRRLYVSYCTFFALGVLFSMQIPFVGFQPMQSSEHLAAWGVFAFLQAAALEQFVRARVGAAGASLLRRMALTALLAFFALAMLSGHVAPWTGRFYSLLDPTYAKEHIPIIASVSEHQPTTWASFFFDLHFLIMTLPVGIYFILKQTAQSSPSHTNIVTAVTNTNTTNTNNTNTQANSNQRANVDVDGDEGDYSEYSDAGLFLVLYGAAAVYFAGVMVRLMLVLAPAACLLGGVAVSCTLSAQRKRAGAAVTLGILALLALFVLHSSWVASEAYSSPSIVIAARGANGGTIMFDDFREAYYWLRSNAAEDAVIGAWWDYGYQLTAMSNRTTICDNNTGNYSHIATMGLILASNEDDAIPVIRRLDIDYVLVIFGGMVGYSSDDINKFLWPVRIGGNLYPQIREADYYSKSGQYTVGPTASETMLNSVMYKLCYYRFGELQTDQGRPPGFDRVRGTEIGRKDFKLKYFEEAFTSERWLVRIYRVKPEENLLAVE